MSSENAPLAVGLDFGGTSIKLGVCQGENFVAKADPIPTDGHGSVDALIEVMAVEINKLREAHPAITAVGAGIPGFVDFEKGYLHNLTNVPGWHNVPFKAIMEQKLGLPVLVENDANAMAYAEYKFGAAKGLTNVVCLTLGTGVGGGIILGGEVYRGSSFGAGEIGQMCIDFEGKAGNYGNMGALEKYVGNQQIEEHAILAYANVGQAKAKGRVHPEAYRGVGRSWRSDRETNLGRHRPLAGRSADEHHLDSEPRCDCHRRWCRESGQFALRAARASHAFDVEPDFLGADECCAG